MSQKEIIRDIIYKAKERNVSLSDVIVWISKDDGTYGEDFWKYASGIVLRERGYFVTFYGNGDLSAYSIPDYLNALNKSEILDKGCFIEEPEMIESKKKKGIP